MQHDHKVTARQLEEKLSHQQFKCALTLRDLTPALSSLDHVVPKACGGTDDIPNLQIVLPCINKAKGTMTQSQFIAMCHAVAMACEDTGDTTWMGYTGHPVGG